MVKKLPKIIKDFGFDFRWSEEKVWALDVPSEEMEVSELDWHFNIPFWNTSGNYYNLTPNQVLQNLEKYKEEFDRTMKADSSNPLDVMWWRGRWLLLDGLHRLAKARKLGYKTVKVRKISKSAIPQIIK